MQTEDKLAEGAPVALSFSQGETDSSPVFLAGYVVRQVSGERPGLAVRWERAVTHGSADLFRAFLHFMVGVESPEIERVTLPGRELPRLEYRFPCIVADSRAELEELDASEEEDTSRLADELRRQRRENALKVSDGAMLDMASPAAGRAGARPAATPADRGPLTRQISAGEVLYPTPRLEATFKTAAGPVTGTITHLGGKGLFLLTSGRPSEEVAGGQLTFGLRIRGGMADLSLNCVVVATDDGEVTGVTGYSMAIKTVNEGMNSGVFAAYVRWLSLRATVAG